MRGRYSDDLSRRVDSETAIAQGSEVELEIRAATVFAVELLRDAINGERRSARTLDAFQLDWLLWERGEASLSQLKPHHRTLTIFY